VVDLLCAAIRDAHAAQPPLDFASAKSTLSAPKDFRRGDDQLREQRRRESLGVVDQCDGFGPILGKDKALELSQRRIDLPELHRAGAREVIPLAAIECSGGGRENLNRKVGRAVDGVGLNPFGVGARHEKDIRLVDVVLVEVNVARCADDGAEGVLQEMVVEDAQKVLLHNLVKRIRGWRHDEISLDQLIAPPVVRHGAVICGGEQGGLRRGHRGTVSPGGAAVKIRFPGWSLGRVRMHRDCGTLEPVRPAAFFVVNPLAPRGELGFTPRALQLYPMDAPATRAVFLSYAREDTDAARRVADALRSQGVEVWFDQNELRGGEAWDAKIRKQINDCTLFLPVISQHTQERSKGYFRLEWKLAVEQTHLMLEGIPFLAPVVIDDTPDAGAAVPAEFLRVQWIRLPGALPTPEFVGQVKRLLDEPRTFAHVGRGLATPPLSGSPHETAWPGDPALQRKSRLASWTWAIAVLVLVAVVVFLATRNSAPISTIATNPKPKTQNSESMDLAPAKSTRIAVLPLDNISPDANDAYIAFGMTEELTSCLSKISGLEVIARTSAEQAKKAGKNVSQIGAELRVGTLLEGSVSKDGERLRIAVQLIDVTSQRHLWSENYNTEFKDVFKMRSDVAQRVAETLKVRLLGSEVQRLKKEPTANVAAHRFYILGRYLWNKRTGADEEKAIAYFKQAIALDPLYAEAHLGLALCYGSNYIRIPAMEAVAKSGAAAKKALELDPTLGEAHIIAALAKWDNDWIRTENEYRLAIQLSPNSAFLHHWFAQFYRFQRRFDEGLIEIRRAQELDPLSLVIIAATAATLLEKGEIENAIQECRRGLELDPDFAQLHLVLGHVYVQKRSFPEALAELRKARALDPAGSSALGYLGYALARSGDRGSAIQILNELEELGKKGFEVRVDIAYLHAGLGDTEKALEFLEQAQVAREPVAEINADPMLDELRPHPRFQALLRKMNLVK